MLGAVAFPLARSDQREQQVEHELHGPNQAGERGRKDEIGQCPAHTPGTNPPDIRLSGCGTEHGAAKPSRSASSYNESEAAAREAIDDGE